MDTQAIAGKSSLRSSGSASLSGPEDGEAKRQEERKVQVRRRKVNAVDEMFEALMALIDSAQGMRHDPAANRVTVEEAVQGSGNIIHQRVVD